MKYLIASKTVEIDIPEDWPSASVLLEELREYPASTRPADIVIRYTAQQPSRAIASNPTSYQELEAGFAIGNYHTSVAWTDQKPVEVTVAPVRAGKNWVKKLTNMQFTHPYEQIGQVFHEFVLVPTFIFHFNREICLIHGSSVRNKDTAEAMIITGTGGVGKTLSEIEMMLSRRYDFLSDDIAFLDAAGRVWPNYAYPKIYAYNVIQSPAIRSRLFQNRSLFDRIWWRVSLLRGPGQVRRRACPSHLYGPPGQPGACAPLKRLVFLFRRDVSEVTVKELNPSKAIDMNLAVIEGELNNLMTALSWQAYNRAYLEKPAFDRQALFAGWRALQTTALQGVRCQIIEIPMHYRANDLRQKILPVLTASQ